MEVMRLEVNYIILSLQVAPSVQVGWKLEVLIMAPKSNDTHFSNCRDINNSNSLLCTIVTLHIVCFTQGVVEISKHECSMATGDIRSSYHICHSIFSVYYYQELLLCKAVCI